MTMSIFSRIKDAIWGHKAAPVEAAPSSPNMPQMNTPSDPGTPAPAAAAPAPAAPVDVEAVLTQKAAAKGQDLNWRTSIVDLMKVLDLDSSHANRLELAKELGFTGDTNDSASMNIWLHKQVMAKLAQSGGKVPAELAN
ncbi:DUF3597 domain-containing protein [Sphingomonas sp. PAMC 26617]|uniref:DUF3597 domain-containing protein n=1 Tax=Sphingomonas sp. PAMC 26617 TaxID=1112216 RepID=UPI000288A44B